MIAYIVGHICGHSVQSADIASSEYQKLYLHSKKMTLPSVIHLILGNPSNTVPFTVPTKIVLPRFHLSSGLVRASEVELQIVFKEPIKDLFLYATEQEQNNLNTSIKLC